MSTSVETDLGRSDRGGMIKAAWVVGAATLLSRVLGLIRDAVLAFLLGATPAADAFFVAFRIPNLVRQLFGEGALASSFVPVYTDVLEKRGRSEAARFSDSLFSVLLMVLVVISAAGVIFAPEVVRTMAYGFTPGSFIHQQTVMLTRWMFPYVLLVCVAAYGMGILNAHRHFLAPSLAPTLLNVSIILFALYVSPRAAEPTLALAWGVLVGGLLQALFQVPSLVSRGVMPRFILPRLTPEIRRVAVMMGPAVLGVAVYQVNILVDTLLASFLPTGSITYLWYGNRMMQFPLGVFGIALATAALPTLSSQVAEGRLGDFTRTVSYSVGLTAFIGFPAALGLVSLRTPIMATLFGRGAFSVSDVAGSASALLFYSLGLPFFIGVKILGRAFFAREDTRVPFLAAIAALICNAVLNLILMGPMLWSGLALATTLASALNFTILAVVFSRREGRGWIGYGLFPEVVRSLAASILMAMVTIFAAGRIPWNELPTTLRALWLLGCVTLGIVVYSAICLALGSQGMKTVKNRILNRKAH